MRLMTFFSRGLPEKRKQSGKEISFFRRLELIENLLRESSILTLTLVMVGLLMLELATAFLWQPLIVLLNICLLLLAVWLVLIIVLTFLSARTTNLQK